MALAVSRIPDSSPLLKRIEISGFVDKIHRFSIVYDSSTCSLSKMILWRAIITQKFYFWYKKKAFVETMCVDKRDTEGCCRRINLADFTRCERVEGPICGFTIDLSDKLWNWQRRYCPQTFTTQCFIMHGMDLLSADVLYSKQTCIQSALPSGTR